MGGMVIKELGRRVRNVLGHSREFGKNVINRIYDVFNMKFGVCVPNYGESSSTDALRTIALEAEREGCDSIWTTDHILIPRNSGTPYEKIFDSITTLSYLAAITSRARL